MPIRWITFGGSTLTIEYEGPEAARLINLLYREIPDAMGQPPHHTYRFTETAGQFNLYHDEEFIHSDRQGAVVADMLQAESCYRLAAGSVGGLLFHAAGVARLGQGVLLPGTMGAGKTTLTAWLLSRGYDYLTDELVFIAAEETTLQGFARPLNLKPPYQTALAGLVDFKAAEAQILHANYTDLISPTLFNPAGRASQPPLRLILFPRYQAGVEFSLTRLSKAQAGLALMQCLINARNLPEHGFPEIVRLAALAPAYKINYAHFDQIGEQIEVLLGGSA